MTVGESEMFHPIRDDVFTPTQFAFNIHAKWIHRERAEERARLERTCAVCGKEEVRDGECHNEKCKAVQPGKIKRRTSGVDVIVWPPGSGNRYVGDHVESAAQKFKRLAAKRGDMKTYRDYMRSIGYV